MTGQWQLQELPFGALRLFFPAWSAEERVALYAIAGGIPAYLEWLDPARTLVENIRDVILAPGSMFMAEPQFLLYDEVREPQTHLALLKAIGMGSHSLNEISNASLVGKAHLSSYLAILQALRLVERRLPVTIPPAQRRNSRVGRYHLADPYFRFYFRFMDPYQTAALREQPQMLERLRDNLRAFVGQTAFEALAQRWVHRQGQAGRFGWEVQEVGSHWSRRVQVDVVGVNWTARRLLLGECKWTGAPVDVDVVQDLVQTKAPKVLADLAAMTHAWTVQFACFARAGYTPAAHAAAAQHGVTLVDLPELDADLSAES